jgi:hypothetical protein
MWRDGFGPAAVGDSSARAARVAEVHRAYLSGHRYADVGISGFGLYEIVDDGGGAFENRPHRSTSQTSGSPGPLA